MFETEIGRILAKRGYQKGILEGRKEGREEGMLEGREEGRLEEKQASIKKLLEIRFGKLSPSVEDQIEATTDLDELDRLFMQAATAKSLQEIRFNN